VLVYGIADETNGGPESQAEATRVAPFTIGDGLRHPFKGEFGPIELNAETFIGTPEGDLAAVEFGFHESDRG
jgi:hypothetical protein